MPQLRTDWNVFLPMVVEHKADSVLLAWRIDQLDAANRSAQRMPVRLSYFDGVANLNMMFWAIVRNAGKNCDAAFFQVESLFHARNKKRFHVFAQQCYSASWIFAANFMPNTQDHGLTVGNGADFFGSPPRLHPAWLSLLALAQPTPTPPKK